MSVESGQTLSHYRLLEKIGEGGMGVVWKAEDTVLNRTVAIKVLPADVSRDEKRRQMFLQEAQLASQVSDAHIVQVYEFGQEGDLNFIVMEYVEGRALNKHIHSGSHRSLWLSVAHLDLLESQKLRAASKRELMATVMEFARHCYDLPHTPSRMRRVPSNRACQNTIT